MKTVGTYLPACLATGTRIDREALLAHVLGWSRAELITRRAAPLADDDAGQLDALLERLESGEPVAYLTGRVGFHAIELEMRPGVLVPRPETELLVDFAIAQAPRRARVLDLGTGSGAVALALAAARPDLEVSAVDRSTAALGLAARNATRLGLDVEFVASDWLSAVGGRFDLIVANPPYVAANDPHLAALGAEPLDALVGGCDGLTHLRTIIATASRNLGQGSCLAVEHGFDQGAVVRALMRASDYRDVATQRDYAGHERITRGARP